MADRYEPSAFESKWQQRWEEHELFRTREEEGRPKFYGLDFFPYPSGAGLSVGHCRNYVPTDVLCRMKYMQGFNVLHPMGFDAFGLPAENEALKRHSHPAPMIERYAENYKRQMDLVGISYDWSRSFKSSDPSYYKWTQWIFELLYKQGLAYRKQMAVNWDPVDKTVLADEEIVGGRAERSGALVEKKWIPQWLFKITQYAQRLIDDLETLDWPDGIKAQQRNWIGRSEGVQFTLKVAEEGVGRWALGVGVESPSSSLATSRYDLDADPNAQRPTPNALSFEVFTTRIDTIFGMTFCVLAPEHPLVDQIKKQVDPEHQSAIDACREGAAGLSDTDRTATNRGKTGVFTGAYAINPANGKQVPIWLADYVLATYGTGAIMAVPGHDSRDFEFATKFGIPVVQVIAPGATGGTDPLPNPPPGAGEGTGIELPFEAKDGVLVNSGEYDGMNVAEAQLGLGRWIEAHGIGERKIQYRLRDWLISRQRYWGCPIPVIHSKEGDIQLVPEKDLPVYLPDVDNYEPSGDGTSPLAGIDEFVNVTDLDGRLGKRETDTMGGFACSSWYFLRFCDPHNEEKAWDQSRVNYWMPVDAYVGGAEHAVMHLLYARFWTKVLYDAGLVPTAEPFARLENQGQVLANTPYRKPREGESVGLGEDGILVSFEEAATLPDDEIIWRWARMSKSKGNVVTPDEAKEQYGADALRIYLMFVAPFNADVNWSNEGMQGAVRFLSRIFALITEIERIKTLDEAESPEQAEFNQELTKKIRRKTHQTIAKVTSDIERFSFNTAISAMMVFVNELAPIMAQSLQGQTAAAVRTTEVRLALNEAAQSLVLLLAPFAPHSADELWEMMGREGFTYSAWWPKFDAELAKEDTVPIAVQVNGKLRDTVIAPAGADNQALEDLAKASAKVQAHLEGKTIRKVIVVPGKLVNFVVS